jgi:hypothetical protein
VLEVCMDMGIEIDVESEGRACACIVGLGGTLSS